MKLTNAYRRFLYRCAKDTVNPQNSINVFMTSLVNIVVIFS